MIAFFDAGTLCQAVTFDLLTLKVRSTLNVTWSKSLRNLSEMEQSPAELLIILRIFAHVMSRRNLDLWPHDFELLHHFGCHAFKLCTKSERNRIIHGWVIDDIARFVFACNFRGWVRTDSRVRGPNFTKLGLDIGRSSQHCTFVSEFGYLAAFSNEGSLNLREVSNDAKFRTFWPPPPVKIRGSLYQLLKLYLLPNLLNTFDDRPLRGCWSRWIDKKERKKLMGNT